MPGPDGKAPAPAAVSPAPGRQAAQSPAAQPAAGSAASATQSLIPDKGLFWGLTVGFNDYEYDPDLFPEREGFNAGLLLGYDFGLLAGQVELLYVMESFKTVEQYMEGFALHNYTTKNSVSAIQIPVLLKLDLHLWRFMIQPLAGVYVNIPLGGINREMENFSGVYPPPFEDSIDFEESPFLGLTFGGAVGFRIGKGYIFFDARYVSDFGDTKPEGGGEYKRSGLTVNLGYQRYF
jgi:hypothetical protein